MYKISNHAEKRFIERINNCIQELSFDKPKEFLKEILLKMLKDPKTCVEMTEIIDNKKQRSQTKIDRNKKCRYLLDKELNIIFVISEDLDLVTIRSDLDGFKKKKIKEKKNV